MRRARFEDLARRREGREGLGALQAEACASTGRRDPGNQWADGWSWSGEGCVGGTRERMLLARRGEQAEVR